MTKRILTLVMAALLASAAWAVPARSTLFRHTQKDGTVLALRLVGDEFLHYYVNSADGGKMYRAADGDFHPLSEGTAALQARKAANRRSMVNARRSLRMKSPARRAGQSGSITGQKKGLVIVVNFNDKALASSHTQADFDNMFNQTGYNRNGHIGSVSEYFKEQSYGQFSLAFDVVGPVELSKSYAYYGRNDDEGNDLHPGEMVAEACRLADPLVDFSDYDWDGDGEVDQVFVIYAGYGENYDGVTENAIWPHEWELSSCKVYGDGPGAFRLDGVSVDTYACSSELSGNSGTTLCGIGTACHEFSHCLGYPDMYDTDYSGALGMDNYDVMCGGSYNGPYGNGEVPCGFTAYERWMAGWLQPVELDDPATVTGMPSLTTSPTAYLVRNGGQSNEYFLLENRQAERWFGYFGSNRAGHGLFITHVDYSRTAWDDNSVNDNPDHQRMTWVPADKAYRGSRADEVSASQMQGDFFPGTGGVTAFIPASWSSAGGKWFSRDSNGTYFSDHDLSSISESDGTVSFLFDGGADDTRFTVTFDAGTGSCPVASWTQTVSRRESTILPTATLVGEDWTFAGWATAPVALETTSRPQLLKAGEAFTPQSDCTLHAVYARAEKDGSGVGGSYTLDYGQETALSSSKSWGSYGTSYTYTAQDGGVWVVKAYKSKGMQINKGKNASIKVPECPGTITTIEVTDDKAKVLQFSATDYNGVNSPVSMASSESSTSTVIDLSGKNATTGYIYTLDGATVITRIVVNYGNAITYHYHTYPSQPVGEISISPFGLSTYSIPQAYIMPQGLQGALVRSEQAVEGGFRLALEYRYEEGDAVPVGEALLIKGEPGTYAVLSTVTDRQKASSTDNELCADYILQDGRYLTAWCGSNELDDELYYYKLTTRDGAGFGWYWGADEGAAFYMSRPDRAYLVLERSMAQQIKGMTLNDMLQNDATGISTVPVAASPEAVYDLTGRRLRTSPRHGIYIQGGRKYIRK